MKQVVAQKLVSQTFDKEAMGLNPLGSMFFFPQPKIVKLTKPPGNVKFE